MIEKLKPLEYQDSIKTPETRVMIAPDNWKLMDKLNELTEEVNRLSTVGVSSTWKYQGQD
jgi:hypothetical protein